MSCQPLPALWKTSPHYMLDTPTVGHGIVELSTTNNMQRKERGMKSELSQRISTLEELNATPELSAQMANYEINILAITDSYILYEFSYINDETKMKKWAKRLAPLQGGITSTYEYLIKTVKREREAMGQ